MKKQKIIKKCLNFMRCGGYTFSDYCPDCLHTLRRITFTPRDITAYHDRKEYRISGNRKFVRITL